MHNINQSRTNMESVTDAWASLAEHLSLLYMSCPQQMNPDSTGVLVSVPYPSSSSDSSLGVTTAQDGPTEQELGLVASNGNVIFSGACPLPCPTAWFKTLLW